MRLEGACDRQHDGSHGLLDDDRSAGERQVSNLLGPTGIGANGESGIIVAGATVVTAKGVVPFLIWLAGIASDPLTVIGAEFCPGAWLPPWLVQVEVTSAVVLSVTNTSPLPSPDSAPDALSVTPLSVKFGAPTQVWRSQWRTWYCQTTAVDQGDGVSSIALIVIRRPGF